MKNILVPTDFSATAKVAALYAAGLARQTGGRVILSHTYQPVAFLEEEEGGLRGEETEKAAQAQMDHLARELHAGFNISVSRLLKPGFAADEILFLARKVKADVVVMGMQGASLKTDQWLGRITAEILQKAIFPVLCVPSGATFKEISCIAWLGEGEDAFHSAFSGADFLHDLGVKQVALPLKPVGEPWQVSVPVAVDPSPELTVWAMADDPAILPSAPFGEDSGQKLPREENEGEAPLYQPQLLVCSARHFRSLQSSMIPGHQLLQDQKPFLVFPEGIAA
jgi:nucleotide-binding universal stress UspA family protein